MKIVVCIKQVPDVDDIKWTKENNLDRSQMLSKINRHDDWALNWAIKIKNNIPNVTITALSMGPEGAKSELEYALAKGADSAILLSDKAFAASDTLATSKILSCAIKKYIGDFDVILTGQMAQDGDTAQVPVSMAQMLDIFDVTNCSKIYYENDEFILKQDLEDKINIFKLKPPFLAAIKEQCDINYLPKIDDYVRAQNIKIISHSFDDLGIPGNEVGIIGSPTYVYRAFRPKIEKEPIEIRDDVKSFILKEIEQNRGMAV